MAGVTLDSGALIAFDRNDRRVVAMLTRARAAGQLCGARHTADVIDASVVLCARARGHRILTSDVDDLRRLDPSIPLIRV